LLIWRAMVIDSSAAFVILLGEAEDDAFATAIDADPRRLMSAVSVLETSIAVESRKDPQAAVSWIFSCTAAGSTWFRSTPTSWSWRAQPIAASAKAIMPPRSISATAAPMHLLQARVSLFCSRAMTSAGPTSLP